MTAVTSDIKRKGGISIILSVFKQFTDILTGSMLIYYEVISLPNNLGCVESAAPTSQLYAFSTVIQMITENHILCRYAALQWHDVATKNRECQ
jgi:hypothetical protein